MATNYPLPPNSPATPVITFLVSLPTLPGPGNGGLSPNAYQSNPVTGRTNDVTQAGTRVTFFPGLLRAENRELHDGDTFMLSGLKANYYRKEIAKGNFPFLSIQSIIV